MIYPNINPDRAERVNYDRFDYPVYVRKGCLSAYPNYRAESHWHDDVEFILILSGRMQYNINGEVIEIAEGEGVFVNTRQLHFGYSDKKSDCVFICVLLHPVLLCSSRAIEQKYVNPILFNEHIPFCLISRKNEWEISVLNAIKNIYDYSFDKISELKIQRAFYDIWIALCENVISITKDESVKNHNLFALKDMISYINSNYQEKISLEDIAKAGKVGKTGCCNLFKKYVNKTPNGFLTDLRLKKGVELLNETDKTILEISYEVGFSGASYFTETFRKNYGLTPKEYRKNNAKKL